MVSNSIIAGIVTSIVLMLGVIIYAVIYYRKKGFVLSAWLWGILASFLFNALGQMITMGLFALFFNDQDRYVAFVEGGSWASVAYSSLVATLAFVVAVILVTALQRRRDKVNEYTAEMTGTFAALFSWINPLQGTLMYFVNMLMYSFAINEGSDVLQATETFPQERIDALVEMLVSSTPWLFIRVAVMHIALLVAYRFVFILIGRVLGKPVPMLVVSAIYFVTYFVMQLLSFDSMWVGFALLGYLAIAAVLYIISQRKPLFVES